MSTNENGYGVILSLADLREKLQTISSGPHQWSVELVQTKPAHKGWTTSHAEIWYTNPELTDMPNEICLSFPAFRDWFWGVEESFVCLHPGLAQTVQPGLYFEGERLLYDCIEDFERFWPPIREILS